MDEDWPRLHRVLFASLARKPRTLRELASDLPGEDWSMRDISEALLALRERGCVRFLDGAWRVGAAWGRTGHRWVLIKGDGPWNSAPGPWPDDLDAAAKSANTAMIRLSSPYGF